MKRKAIHLRTSNNGRRAIYIDAENADEIYEYANQDKRHKKKFQHIVGVILDGTRYPTLYDKENINERCKDVTAMKLFKGQENDRIYCKEISKGDKTFVVVVAELLERKKTQKNTSREISIIEKVASYEYEFED